MAPTLKADLVVVGGGPAGSGAAEAALQAKPDLNVIVLEKRERPHGTCAGGLGFTWNDLIGIKIPRHLIEVPLYSVAIHGPTETARVTNDEIGVPELGWILDRWGFDDWLLKRAEGMGAWAMRKTAFKDIQRVNHEWIVTAENADGAFTIETPYVIDASGPMAAVGRRLGMTIDDADQDIHTGLQYTVPLPPGKSPNEIEMWFKRDPNHEGDWSCRSGYVWQFPSSHGYWDDRNPHKAGRYTRLGCGVDQENNRLPGHRAKDVMERFIANFPEYGGAVVSTNGGYIPTGKPLQNAQAGCFVVGDAGRHCSPLHGGGILFGRLAGQEAGRVCATKGTDQDFEQAWQKQVGYVLRAHFALKACLYALDNKEIDIMIRELSGFRPATANPITEIPRAAKMLVSHPVLGAKSAVRAMKALL